MTIAPVIQPHRLARLKLAILLLHSAVTIVWAEPVAASANWATNLIPEPLLYDLTLPLDTPGGQVEVNSIFRVPAGSGKVISVPEIEGTVADGLGFELEIEFDGSEQNGWSAASQYTFGRTMQQQLVHGGQLVIERDDNERTTDLVAMYIPGYRFNPVWSALLMVGARIPLSGSGNETEDTRFVFNGSVFAETSASWTWGLELNFRADIDRSEKLVVVPQVHWQSTGGFGIQGGLGLRHENSSYKTEYIARVIYGF